MRVIFTPEGNGDSFGEYLRVDCDNLPSFSERCQITNAYSQGLLPNFRALVSPLPFPKPIAIDHSSVGQKMSSVFSHPCKGIVDVVPKAMGLWFFSLFCLPTFSYGVQSKILQMEKRGRCQKFSPRDAGSAMSLGTFPKIWHQDGVYHSCCHLSYVSNCSKNAPPIAQLWATGLWSRVDKCLADFVMVQQILHHSSSNCTISNLDWCFITDYSHLQKHGCIWCQLLKNRSIFDLTILIS